MSTMENTINNTLNIDDIVKKIQTIKKKDINCLNHKHV